MCSGFNSPSFTTCWDCTMVQSAAVHMTGLKLRPASRNVRLPHGSACHASTSATSPFSAYSSTISRPWISRTSLPRASGVPTDVGVKKAPTPAPAARMRSARVPCGTISSSILPARYNSSNTTEPALRGNEQSMRRTLPRSSSRASPVRPLPALFATTVNSETPVSIRPSMSCSGWPTAPKPPINTVEPFLSPCMASAMDRTILSIMPARPPEPYA